MKRGINLFEHLLLFIAAAKMADSNGVVKILFSILWLILLIFIAFPIAGFCAGWYILFQPFSVCIEGCAVSKTLNALRVGRLWAEFWRSVPGLVESQFSSLDRGGCWGHFDAIPK
jgi:hypothetical protein